ncbi:MAG TPA: hypothetical protein VGM03_19390 [Phycisphaerae bacterium]
MHRIGLRNERFALQFMAEHPGMDAADLIRRRLPIGLRKLLSVLARQDHVGQTLRINAPQSAHAITPIRVTFEPRLLDECEPSFEELESAVTPAGPGARDEDREIKLYKRRLRKVFVRGGGAVLLLSALPLGFAAIQALRLRRVTRELGQMAGLVLVAALSFLAVNGTLSPAWFVAPGCLIVRGRRGLRVYERQHSILCVTHLKDTALVLLADARGGVRRVVTHAESEFLLRAWLSPVPAPPLERLSDLA